MSQVLEGIRIVELASWTFVPSCGAVLAEWGADVIKVEDPSGGDPARGLVVGGLMRSAANADRDFMMELGNRGKRSVAINLRNPEGYEIFAALIKGADVFLTNWLPSARLRLGLDEESIRKINPAIIYARGSGHGQRGPDREKGGFDGASFLSRGGVAYALTPEGSDRPISQTPALGDLPSGLTLAGGVAAALFRRERTGLPSVVDVSLLAQAVWTIAPEIMAADFFNVERIPAPVDSGTPRNPVMNKYETKDGRWVWLNILQPDRHWAELCAHIGRPALAVDPRFTPSSALAANAAQAARILTDVFLEHDVDHWRTALATLEAVWAVIATPREVLDDPQVVANGYLIENEDNEGHRYRVAANPVQFDGEADGAARSPEHGEHTELVLLDAGLSWEQIAHAKEVNAIL